MPYNNLHSTIPNKINAFAKYTLSMCQGIGNYY